MVDFGKNLEGSSCGLIKVLSMLFL